MLYMIAVGRWRSGNANAWLAGACRTALTTVAHTPSLVNNTYRTCFAATYRPIMSNLWKNRPLKQTLKLESSKLKVVAAVVPY